MTHPDDVAIIKRQEHDLVFPGFDETKAYALGARLHRMATERRLGIICDIRLWDRQLFYFAMPGTTADNPEWARRKHNVVRRFQKSSYRIVRERNSEDRNFPEHLALPQADYALAGGGFPIRVAGVGVIGSVTVSGLPQREDHLLVVEAIALELGRDPAQYVLPPF
jgi:uncharacterized protein (UPF0303 family)